MKRPIKFRGCDTRTGEYIFGSYCRTSYCDLGVWHAIIDESGEAFIVEESSVAQFVGIDSAGNEVYEGDKVIGEYGDEVVARLMDNLPPKAKLKLSEDTK